MALDRVVKCAVKEQGGFEILKVQFCQKYSAKAMALDDNARLRLMTIQEETETRDGEPLHNVLEIFQRDKHGKPLTSSRLESPVTQSPISSIASAVPPEPYLYSKCCERVRKNCPP